MVVSPLPEIAVDRFRHCRGCAYSGTLDAKLTLEVCAGVGEELARVCSVAGDLAGNERLPINNRRSHGQRGGTVLWTLALPVNLLGWLDVGVKFFSTVFRFLENAK